jgi:hypothetical protein
MRKVRIPYQWVKGKCGVEGYFDTTSRCFVAETLHGNFGDLDGGIKDAITEFLLEKQLITEEEANNPNIKWKSRYALWLQGQIAAMQPDEEQ